jgi:hypothetical protein
VDRSAAPGERGRRLSSERSHGRRGDERRAARSRGRGNAGSKEKVTPPGRERAGEAKRLGQEKRSARLQSTEPRGRARPEAPPSSPPVQRGALEPKAPPPPRVQVQPPPTESAPVPVPEAPVAPAPKDSPSDKVKLPK